MPRRKRNRKKDSRVYISLDDSSPASAYKRFRQRQADESTQLHSFISALDFTLDNFQIEACKALESGKSVLVAAPTGAGKTIVGQFAVDLALAQEQKVVYTTPIKALSNQKFKEFGQTYGTDKVGLLTGDVVLNRDAPIIVATTEVLRNMLYAEADFSSLGYVVLDEVHYLADKFRGPVWEEVILHLPESVKLVCLSATVSNAEEFGAWLNQVRGNCHITLSERRPVPLWQHMMVGRRLFDLYPAGIKPQEVNAASKVNPDLAEVYNRASSPNSSRYRGGYKRGGRLRPAPRGSIVEVLEKAHLLPAIYFIFSRAACDDAMRDLLASGVSLVTFKESQKIARLVDEKLEIVPKGDYSVLELPLIRECLVRGFAAHHAGLLPLVKELVEDLFKMGLVKVVFATETLALGINMPARTVILENLVKWDGSEHVTLTPGQFTQLTGRAGRRGIDSEGHAVVLARDSISPHQVAALASRRSYPLNSVFIPTYNMVANLLSRSNLEQAQYVIERSFAQFQSNKTITGYARELDTLKRKLRDVESSVTCEYGDPFEYAELRSELSQVQKECRTQRRISRSVLAKESFSLLQRGDIIAYEYGRQVKFGIVIFPASPIHSEPAVQIVTQSARLRSISAVTIPGGVTKIGRKRLPESFNARAVKERASLQRSLQAAAKNYVKSPAKVSHPLSGPVQRELELKELLRQHPAGRCPKLENHVSFLRNQIKLKGRIEKLEKTMASQSSSLALRLQNISRLLRDLGYLENDFTLNEWGHMLAKIHSERDLLISQIIRFRLLSDLTPLELAAFASACVFEPRGDLAVTEPPAGLSPILQKTLKKAFSLASDLAHQEVDYGLDPNAGLEPGIMLAVHEWAAGVNLSTVLEYAALPSGDFVRWVKMSIDLLEHLAQATEGELGERARDAARLLNRGVVAWQTV
ncbi:DEAD/DEAH box helicase [Actinomycetaceae bacterium TAE3-ERU4]|nr:DEAD/DEAH box helicase [Actinomycetaceae bacterium TAE3-ERU4]